MPRNRLAWAEAMKAEIEAIEDPPAAFFYATGCILACGKERVLEMDVAEKTARLGLPAIMLILSVFAALSAGRTSGADPAAGLLFGLLAAIWATSAVWSLWRGPEALVQAASSMLIVNLVAFFFLRSSPAVAERWANAALYQALAREGVFIWTTLLIGAAWLATRRQRAQS